MTEYVYHSFPEEEVQEAISSARSHYAGESERAGVSNENGRLQTFAACITATIRGGRLCLKLPFGLGKVCIPIPFRYNGKVAEVCLHVCTVWGIPTDVELVITVGGRVIVRKPFGYCS